MWSLLLLIAVGMDTTSAHTSNPQLVHDHADPTHARRVAAMVGGVVADAAAGPLFWIYDVNEIEQILKAAGREATPEFFSPSHAPFTPQYPVGAVTSFGEQTMIYARSLAAEGRVDPQAIADAYTAYYTPPANTSRPYASYYDQATKKFLANVEAGKKWPHTGDDDAETNAVAHVLPVVVMLAGKPNLLADAEAAIRVVQDNDDAVAFGLLFVRILERVILGEGVLDAIRATAAELRAGTGSPDDVWLAHGLAKMEEWAPRPPLDVTLEVGQSCDFPFNAFTAPHLLFHHNGTVSYEDAIRETIKIGGENANRGSFIGSLLAAAAGSVQAAVPPSWINKTIGRTELLALAEKLASSSNTVRTGSQSATPVDIHTIRTLSKRARTTLSDTVASSPPPPPVAFPPSHPDDIAGLTALYHSAGGPQWEESDNWLNTSVSVCEWDRIVCNVTTGRVVWLRFLGNGLQGTLPDELGLLTSMTELHLGWNPGLRGPIPSSIGKMTQLERLFVWNASITSVPHEISGCKSLITLDLTDNRISEPLPTGLASLANVNTAYFDGNPRLPCPIPPAVQSWLRGVSYHVDPCP